MPAPLCTLLLTLSASPPSNAPDVPSKAPVLGASTFVLADEVAPTKFFMPTKCRKYRTPDKSPLQLLNASKRLSSCASLIPDFVRKRTISARVLSLAVPPALESAITCSSCVTDVPNDCEE